MAPVSCIIASHSLPTVPPACFSAPLHLGGAEAVEVSPHSTMAPRLHVSMGPSNRVSHSWLAAGAGTAASAVLIGADRLAHSGPLVLVEGLEAELEPPPSRSNRPCA